MPHPWLIALALLLPFPSHGSSVAELDHLPLSVQIPLRLLESSDALHMFRLKMSVYTDDQVKLWSGQDPVAAGNARRKLQEELDEAVREQRSAFQYKDQLQRERSALNVEYYTKLSGMSFWERQLEHWNKWLWNGDFVPRANELIRKEAAAETIIARARARVEELRARDPEGSDPVRAAAEWLEEKQPDPVLRCNPFDRLVVYKPWTVDRERLPFGRWSKAQFVSNSDREFGSWKVKACVNQALLPQRVMVSDGQIHFISVIDYADSQWSRVVVKRIDPVQNVILETRIRDAHSPTL